MYPVTTFVHLDDVHEIPYESERLVNVHEEPVANSTLIDHSLHTQANTRTRFASPTPSNVLPENLSAPENISVLPDSHFAESSSHGVGHISHIPRTPPSPKTYTVPSIVNKSMVPEINSNKEMFGMIKLKDNDVCYTSGTIEWVGSKRSFPINSGFKILDESLKQGGEPLLKKIRTLDRTFTKRNVDKIKECDCADVLPTVNAIVDHLNALHEAVDLVDLRLNTIEDTVKENN